MDTNFTTAVSMPLKAKHRTAHGVVKNGAYRPRTGNSWAAKRGAIKCVPRVAKTQQT